MISPILPPSTEEFWSAWEDAVCRFCTEHHQLLTLAAHEQAITHQLGVLLADAFPDWDVDCEYDRLGKEQKRLDHYRDRLEAEGLPVKDLGPAAVRPDIIVHHRGHPTENRLVVEVKRASSNRNRRYDLIKLECLLEELSYSYGVFIEFGESVSTPITDEVRFDGRVPPMRQDGV